MDNSSNYEEIPPFGPLGPFNLRAFRRGDPRYTASGSVSPGSASAQLGGVGGGFGGGGGQTGPRGPQGPQGEPGVDGINGTNGDDGVCDEETLNEILADIEAIKAAINGATIECDGSNVTLIMDGV